MGVDRSEWPGIHDVTPLEHFLPDQPAAGRGHDPAHISGADPAVQRQPCGADPDQDGVGGHGPRGEARIGHIADPDQLVRQKTIQKLEDHGHHMILVTVWSGSVDDIQHLPEVQPLVRCASEYLFVRLPTGDAPSTHHGIATSKTQGPASRIWSPSSCPTISSILIFHVPDGDALPSVVWNVTKGWSSV